MAGEKIGKTYEALLKVVLDDLKSDGIISENVYWNETPEGIFVEPDFTIGKDKDHYLMIIPLKNFAHLQKITEYCRV